MATARIARINRVCLIWEFLTIGGPFSWYIQRQANTKPTILGEIHFEKQPHLRLGTLFGVVLKGSRGQPPMPPLFRPICGTSVSRVRFKTIFRRVLAC